MMVKIVLFTMPVVILCILGLTMSTSEKNGKPGKARFPRFSG